MKINEIEPNYPDHHGLIASKHGLLMEPHVIKLMAFAQTVKDDCQPYLKEVDYSPAIKYALLRGINTTKTYIAKRVRLENRIPKDISTDTHNRINKYFQEHYGAQFRNSMLVTSNLSQAEEYAYGGLNIGSVYVIFPVGQFEYLWSPTVTDMLDIVMATDDFEADLETYQTTDLKAGIRSGHEIMIRCKEYYGFKWSDKFIYKHWRAFEELLRS